DEALMLALERDDAASGAGAGEPQSDESAENGRRSDVDENLGEQPDHASRLGDDPEHDAPVAQAPRFGGALAEGPHVAEADRTQAPACGARARDRGGHRQRPALGERARGLGVAGAGAVGADLEDEALAAPRGGGQALEEPALAFEQRRAVEDEF